MADPRLVLFFTRGVSLKQWDDGGMFAREVALYQRLQQAGFHISFVTYGDRSELRYQDRIPGIRILCNRWGLPDDVYRRWLHLLHGWALWRSDVIKTNQTYGADIARRAARAWRKPLIARGGYMLSGFMKKLHGSDSDVYIQALETEQHLFSVASRVFVTTEVMRQDIVQRLPEVRAKVHVIPNYVDIEQFRPESVSKTQDVIFVGRLDYQKNVESLLKAVEPLTLTLKIIGEGSLEDTLKSRFQSISQRIQWNDRIPHFELPDHLNAARVFILPSHFEGHPKTLIEAMACGLPVIGADSPGIRELITHGETGWLCDTDPASIRQAIQTLLGDADLRERLGDNARRYAVETFALDRIVEQELALLKDVITS